MTGGCGFCTGFGQVRMFGKSTISPWYSGSEMDSNFQYAGAVNLVVSPFGWVVLCDRVRAGRGASGTARYQRRGWAILAAGLGAAHRRSDLWCARLGSTRSDDCLFNRTTLREAEGPSARE